MRAAEHAPRGPFRVLEGRHGLAEIVERGPGDPGAGTVDRGRVPPTCKTLPSTDYKSSGRPEIVVEIRGPTTSRLLQPGAGAARGLLYAVLGPSHAAQYILGPFSDHG